MKQDFVELERQGWQALSSERSAAVDFYMTLLTDDAMMVFPGGMVLKGKEAVLDSLALQPWKSFEIADEQVVSLSDGVTTLVYKVTAQRAESDPYTALISSTYVQRNGTWKLAFHQQTPVSVPQRA